MSDVKIRAANDCEVQTVENFLSKHFDGREPLAMSHVNRDEEIEPPVGNFIEECVHSETVFLAHSNEILVGVLIAGEINLEVGDPIVKDFNFDAISKDSDIQRMLQVIIDKADVCNRLKVPRSLHIHIVSVHQEYQRRGISKKLFIAGEETAKAKNFPVVSVDCTSFYSARIAESFGWHCISTVTYEEFNELVGRIVFRPTEPHLDIKSFAKILS